jgi:6-pyruvoyltetrahydropterin/6-carboxytetrahydropterin synthase
MFSLTVRRHFMVAHSLPRESFGPAQGLHGATFVAEVSFRRAELTPDAIVIDIGAAGEMLQEILDRMNYKNLDELPEFAGQLTTTEVLAKYIAESLAEKLPDGAAMAGIDVVLRENPDAWAGYSLDLKQLDLKQPEVPQR